MRNTRAPHFTPLELETPQHWLLCHTVWGCISSSSSSVVPPLGVVEKEVAVLVVLVRLNRCAVSGFYTPGSDERRPITASPLSPNHSAPRHPTGQIPEESTEAHQPRRDFTRAVHRIIDNTGPSLKRV